MVYRKKERNRRWSELHFFHQPKQISIMVKHSFFLLLPLFALAVFACNKKDDACKTTYSEEVKAIIDNSCAYSGCHSGNTASAWVSEGSKDYTTYEGMLDNLNNGKFALRTLELKNMPPAANFIPEGRPTELTENELNILKCWMENGYQKD
jgi:uncharacterized membrane protein